MKKGGLIVLLGLVLGAGAFSGFYYLGTGACRTLMREPQPELAWLKREFNLSDAEYDRIVRLHEAYLPQCAERCQHIAAQDRQLEKLLAQATNVTPEIQRVFLERAQTRATCETEMLKHFLAVSRTMPAEEGRRYLAWVEQETFLKPQAMEQRHHLNDSQPAGHELHRQPSGP